jgi:hypothetical protein
MVCSGTALLYFFGDTGAASDRWTGDQASSRPFGRRSLCCETRVTAHSKQLLTFPELSQWEPEAERRRKFTSSPPWDVKSNFMTYLKYVITLVFCLERPKKTLNHDSRLPERDMNPGPSKYKAGVLIILYRRRSGQPCDINSNMFHYYRTFSRGGGWDQWFSS